uniref:Putative secreted protein n=1 Tax=Anopheles marajoara TaxID=58244 RepID=A0A2M4C7T9_9DIPT
MFHLMVVVVVAASQSLRCIRVAFRFIYFPAIVSGKTVPRVPFCRRWFNSISLFPLPLSHSSAIPFAGIERYLVPLRCRCSSVSVSVCILQFNFDSIESCRAKPWHRKGF